MSGNEMNQRDRVHGVGFAYDCRIGFHEYERHIRQRLLIDFEVETDWSRAAESDKPEGIVDYYKANQLIGKMIEAREWKLIEAVANDVAKLLCSNFPVSRVRIKVTKSPFDMPNAGGVAVECWRTPEDFGNGLQEV